MAYEGFALTSDSEFARKFGLVALWDFFAVVLLVLLIGYSLAHMPLLSGSVSGSGSGSGSGRVAHPGAHVNPAWPMGTTSTGAGGSVRATT